MDQIKIGRFIWMEWITSHRLMFYMECQFMQFREWRLHVRLHSRLPV